MFTFLIENLFILYKLMAADIGRQQKRLGGTIAVAHAVARRKSRDFLRSLMGPDLVFFVLDTTAECMRERLNARHGSTMDGDNQRQTIPGFRD